MRLRNLLVPTDFGEGAEAALRAARFLCGRFGGRIHLLHVLADPMRYDPWGTESIALRLGEALREAEKVARRELVKVATKRSTPRLRIVPATATGAPADQILAYADTHAIDLIVMGTHGRGMVGHLLLGSVAERVVRRSRVPVLTLHAPVAKAAGGPTRRTKVAPRRVRRRSGPVVV